MTQPIGYLTSQYPAPSHTFIRREVAELRRRGIEIATFSVQATAGSLGGLDREEAAATHSLQGAPVRSLGAAIRAGRFWRRWPSAFRVGWSVRAPGIAGAFKTVLYFVEALALADAMERRGIAHLHNHFSNAGASVGVVAARLAGLSWSFTVHGSADFDGEGALSLGAKVRQARFVACASDYVRSQTLRRTAPAEWHRMFVSRCGINASDPAATKSVCGPEVRVVSVGRLSSEKGQRGLLEAFETAVHTCPGMTLRIVGEGPERADLEAERARLGLEGSVELPGAVAEERIPEELAAADLFVLSSLMEGAPVSLMEAQSAGLAVVAPRLAGIPELITEGLDGRLFTPGRWDELAAILAELAADPEQRERLGIGASEHARSYEISAVIGPMVTALERVLSAVDADS